MSTRRERSALPYSFGRDDVAARRLQLLNRAFRRSTEEFLRDVGKRTGPLETVVDLGCGPGTTAASIQCVLQPRRLVGLDLADGFLEQARREVSAAEFIRHDVTVLPWPVNDIDLVFARDLLTHLSRPNAQLVNWTRLVRRGGIVMVEDDLDVTSANSVFSDYLDIVRQVLSSAGGDLYVARSIRPESLGLKVIEDRAVEVRPSTALTARMFRLNLASWHSRAAARPFSDRLRSMTRELQELERSGEHDEIVWKLRQLAVSAL